MFPPACAAPYKAYARLSGLLKKREKSDFNYRPHHSNGHPSTNQSPHWLPSMQTLTPAALAAWLADPARPAPVILDVREAWEISTAHIAGSLSIPLQSLASRHTELNSDAEIVCICHHGLRSARAAMLLETYGFAKLYNLQGGIDAWSQDVDPAVPRY